MGVMTMMSLYNWSQKENVWSSLTWANNLKDKILVDSLGLKFQIPADCAQLYSDLMHFFYYYTVHQFPFTFTLHIVGNRCTASLLYKPSSGNLPQPTFETLIKIRMRNAFEGIIMWRLIGNNLNFIFNSEL